MKKTHAIAIGCYAMCLISNREQRKSGQVRFEEKPIGEKVSFERNG